MSHVGLLEETLSDVGDRQDPRKYREELPGASFDKSLRQRGVQWLI